MINPGRETRPRVQPRTWISGSRNLLHIPGRPGMPGPRPVRGSLRDRTHRHDAPAMHERRGTGPPL